jgi:hypothetical protein
MGKGKHISYLQIIMMFELQKDVVWRKPYTDKRGHKREAKPLITKVSYQSKYVGMTIRGQSYKYHRLLWSLYHKTDIAGDLEIDHINGDKTDNRIDNLRLVTKRTNLQNTWQHRQGKLSGTYYVSSNKHRKWVARTTINKKGKYIGAFKTQQEAHEAYLSFCKTIEMEQHND